MRVEAQRAFGRVEEDADRRLDERRRIDACGAGELERSEIVVDEQLREVFGAVRQRFEPARRGFVPRRTLSPWNLRVSDVTDEQVRERVLRLPFDRCAALAAHELLAL